MFGVLKDCTLKVKHIGPLGAVFPWTRKTIFPVNCSWKVDVVSWLIKSLTARRLVINYVTITQRISFYSISVYGFLQAKSMFQHSEIFVYSEDFHLYTFSIVLHFLLLIHWYFPLSFFLSLVFSFCFIGYKISFYFSESVTFLKLSFAPWITWFL